MRKYDRPVLESAERALRVIQLLGQRGSLTLLEVAHELGVSPSVAHRLLATCCATGFARQDAPGRPYGVGPALQELSLGASGALSLRDAGATTLARARKQLGETISVVVLEGRTIRFVETLEGEGLVRVSAPIGRTFPAHATAAGRAMLSCLTEDELRQRYPTRTLPRVRSGEQPAWGEFVEELERVRERGWAAQVGEADAEIASVAFPVLDSLGTPRAALTATVPRTRYESAASLAALAAALEPFAKTFQRRLRGSR